MKKRILIYEKDKHVLRYLRSFFKEKKDYAVYFANHEGALRSMVAEKMPDAVIAGLPDGLRRLPQTGTGYPVITMISRDGSDGTPSVAGSGFECYLLNPFREEELDYKLKSVLTIKRRLGRRGDATEGFYPLLELATLASSTLNPDEVLYLIVKKISETIRVTRCSILSIVSGSRRFAKVVSTFEDPQITGIRIDLEKYPEIREALFQKKTVVIKNAQRDPLMKGVKKVIAPLGIRSIVVVPVLFHDEIIGTLLLRTSRKGRAFTKDEISLCSAFANASANALYNAFLYERLAREKEKLEKLAITDYLTGIYNIRYFYKRLDEEFSRADRYRASLSCVMMDIDHFKRINDKYGHGIGDDVLREFAQLVKRHTRRSDLFARYGGEEFILLLPQTSAASALVEAERLREIVKGYRFKPLRAGQQLTVSVGIAGTPDHKIRNADELIHTADTALFKAKEEGRDRTFLHPSVK